MSKRLMYRVTTVEGAAVGNKINHSFFDDKQQAEAFKDMMECKGYSVSLSRWTWEIQVED